MPANKVRAKELRAKKKSELSDQLGKLKNELSQLRVAKVTGGAPSKLAKIHSVKKSIATILTVMNQTQKQQLHLHFKGQKYKPLDLRSKLTRAKRRALKRSELNKTTNKKAQKARHFPQRRFAIKV